MVDEKSCNLRNREESDWGRTNTRDRTELGWPEEDSVRVSRSEVGRSFLEALALTSWAIGTDCSQRGVDWYAVAMS